MTYLAQGQINRVHSMAICKEIGERLGTRLDQTPLGNSPQLITLVRKLRDAPYRIPPDRNP